MSHRTFHNASRAAGAAIAMLGGMSSALAQLNQNCTVSVLNRTVPVGPDGRWVLPNVPANFGQVKARATCIQSGVTVFGESDFFLIPANGAVNLPAITLGTSTPIPALLTIAPASISLTTAGQTAQLVVTATYPDGTSKNVTTASTGTNYTISNPAIATISPGGLVTAVSSGTVVIQANNDGATAIASVPVVLGGATLCGGLVPVSWFLANHLNPADPLVCMEDPDRDGLTNLQEFQAGTDPNNPDTDGDGLNDGDEVNKYKTSPLLPDTDGDRIPDGVEVQTGTNPLDPKSYDLKKATATSVVTPPSITLQPTIGNPVASVQLNWKVNLIDQKTTLDLTADPRTIYSSLDLNVCNFGGQPGLVFSGSAGTTTVTISQNTLTVPVPCTVLAIFNPTEISSINVPGAMAVDVAGSFAYVATGANGLTVVDVTDRTKPRARGTLAGLGNAQAVRASGQNVFIADAGGFLRIVNAQNPDAPTLAASLPIPGSPAALALHGAMVAVAAQAGGVSLVNIATPASPGLIASFAVPAPALGVDFDALTGIAAVAMGTSGLQLADISAPAAPKLRGILAGGDVRRILLKLPAALLADAQRSITAVDVSNPDKPLISVSLPSNLGGVPVDIAAFGNVAISADISFGRAIPVVNISSPLNPSSVGFCPVLNPGFGSSIAVDLSFGYTIIPATGTLRICKYQDIVDPYGIPPTVQITFPTPATTLIQGQPITITVNATDDVAVASVNFLVNGQNICTTSSQPYQCSYIVPKSATTLTFGATASDFGNPPNVGTAANVVVRVIPDPMTTAQGRVITRSTGTAVSGAMVTVFEFSGSTKADGTFLIPGIPTIRGPIVVNAIGVVAGVTVAGSSAPTPPVVGGITNVGDIQVGPKPLITSVKPKSVLAGTNGVSVSVTGANFSGSTFAFSPASTISITTTTIAADGKSASLLVDFPGTAIGTFAVVAASPAGTSDTAITQVNRLTVVDPNSTADTDGDGFQDVIEAVFGTDPLDSASFPVIQTATETESVAFSVLNAPVSGGLVETESVAFSILNTPVSGGLVETESVAFSVLNGPASGGPVETESRSYGVQNAATAQSSTPMSQPAAPTTGPEVKTEAPIGSAIDPLLDSDGDGIPDWLELLLGTDPYNPDTDGDGLSDFEEVFICQTNPLDPDTDGDGFTDGVEILFGSDPLNPASTPLNVAQQRAKNRAVAARAATNSIRQGDSHVKQRSQKQKRVQTTSVGGLSSNFAPGSTRR